ncbi:MAG: peptidylprolyl isomerase [Nitrospinaceae bacterium]|jgi:parvulin-like peptidyl-prolyl isomerase|nr:peptidylprolyl isomerase [Nitrospinaceae bacterium]|tara:strand:- start:680 stop:1759 length:1080 start_codon:yes stop_codon:yes gene_type:complete
MSLISRVNNSVLIVSAFASAFASAFLLTFSVEALADTNSEFTLNGKPVPRVVATVNGTELTADLLKREMIGYKLMASRQNHALETRDEQKIAQGLLMKAIDAELIYQQGIKKNIKIDSATIERELNHIQSQFPDKKLFLAALAAQRLTFDVLKKNIEMQLVKEEFIRMEIAPGVDVDDARVKSFYDENKATFKKPETFQVSHIYVATPDTSEGKAESAEDRAKAKEIIDWVKKEARKKIDEAALILKAGGIFSSVAQEFSEDAKTAEKGGDLGFIMQGQSLPEITDAMIKLKVGETSGVIESSIGFHIIKLTNKKASRPIALEEVKAEILNHLLKFETEKLLRVYLSKLRKKSDIKIFI